MSGRAGVAFAFDMDGVLIDSLPGLYDAYARFMRRHGLGASRAEFATLDGPRIDEIVAILAGRHGLGGDLDALVARYREEVDRAHEAAAVLPGARELLGALRSSGVPLAVASSAPGARVRASLARAGLLDAFDVVVAGDDVERAKPDPAIHARVRERLPAERHVAIEDAPHGIRAAVDAGLYAVQLRRAGAPVAGAAARVVDSMGALAEILPELIGGYRIEGRARDLEVRMLGDGPLLPDGLQREIDLAWARATAERPGLFDGRVLCHAATRELDDALRVEARAHPYREVLAALELREPRLSLAPLGVSGALLDASGRVLVGRRGVVTEYPGWLELVPSGGLPAPARPGPVALVEQLLIELAEETCVPREAVAEVRPLGLVRDELHGVLDLALRMQLRLDAAALGDALARGDEYAETWWIEPGALSGPDAPGPLVPTSAGLLALLGDAKRGVPA